MSYFRTPTSSPFCAVCGSSVPTHYPDCPVLTQKAIPGSNPVSQADLHFQISHLTLRINLLIDSIESLAKLLKALSLRLDSLELKS